MTENYFALHEHILPAVAENEMFLVSLHSTLDDANETKQCRATSDQLQNINELYINLHLLLIRTAEHKHCITSTCNKYSNFLRKL